MKLTFALLLSLIFIGCNAKQAENDAPVKIKTDEDGTSLLWMITSSDLKDTSFLFGTMHMIQKKHYVFTDNLKGLAKSSDALVMELAGLPNPADMMKHIMLPEGENLFDFFSPEQTDTIVRWVTDNTAYSEEMLKNAFGKMKPFALVQLTAMSAFTGEIESYEKEFETIATENKIKIIGLETAEQQMKIFDDLTDEEMIEMVMASFREEDGDELIEKMQMTYKSQNLDSLYALIHSDGGMIAEKEAEFLSNRNKNWIPIIEKIIKKKRAFIAVGAGHLAGEEGVIELLRKEGYTLTPIEL